MFKLVVTLCLVAQLANVVIARMPMPNLSIGEAPARPDCEGGNCGVGDAPARTPLKRYGEGVADSPDSSQSCPSFIFEHVDLKFPRRSTDDYFDVARGLPSMTAMTLCLWMKTTDTSGHIDSAHGGTMFSYATAPRNNEINFYNPQDLSISIGKYKNTWKSGIAVNDGKWHHVCVTWENTAGRVKLYKDGTLAAQSTIHQGYIISRYGFVVIGQDQDRVGGDFQSIDAYTGELSLINIWNNELGPNAISDMSKQTCGAIGNELSWSDVIRLGQKHGQAQVTTSTCVNRRNCE